MEDQEQQTKLKSLFNHFLTSDPENSVTFFVRFLIDNPHYREFFVHLRDADTEEALRKNEWLRNVHVPRLMSSIQHLIENIDDVQAARNEAIRIFNIRKHLDNEIYEYDYGVMFKSLLETIEDSAVKSGRAFDESDRALWVDFGAWIYGIFSDRTTLQNELDCNKSSNKSRSASSSSENPPITPTTTTTSSSPSDSAKP